VTVLERTVASDLGNDEMIHVALTRALRSDGGSPEAAIALLGKVAKERTWQHLSHRQRGPFTSFTEYVWAPLDQGGLGLPRQDVMALLAIRTELERRPGVSDRDRELADYREAIRRELTDDVPEAEKDSRGGDRRSKEFQNSGTVLKPPRDSAASFVSRLKRDDRRSRRTGCRQHKRKSA
jgi:hypothetical protein